MRARYDAQQRREQLRPASPLLVLQRQRDANKLLLLGVEQPDFSPAGQSPCSPLPRVRTNLNLDGFESVLSAPSSLDAADRSARYQYAVHGRAGPDIGSRPHSPVEFDNAKLRLYSTGSTAGNDGGDTVRPADSMSRSMSMSMSMSRSTDMGTGMSRGMHGSCRVHERDSATLLSRSTHEAGNLALRPPYRPYTSAQALPGSRARASMRRRCGTCSSWARRC